MFFLHVKSLCSRYILSDMMVGDARTNEITIHCILPRKHLKIYKFCSRNRAVTRFKSRHFLRVDNFDQVHKDRTRRLVDPADGPQNQAKNGGKDNIFWGQVGRSISRIKTVSHTTVPNPTLQCGVSPRQQIQIFRCCSIQNRSSQTPKRHRVHLRLLIGANLHVCWFAHNWTVTQASPTSILPERETKRKTRTSITVDKSNEKAFLTFSVRVYGARLAWLFQHRSTRGALTAQYFLMLWSLWWWWANCTT